MNCPFCGNGLKEGQLFCEACGKEIQIVPVFEPEIEYKMEQSLNKVRQVFSDEVQSNQENPNNQDNSDSHIENTNAGHVENEPSMSKKRQLLFLIGTGVIFTIVIVILFLINFDYYEYYMKKANDYMGTESYEQVLKYAKKATNVATHSSDAKMLLAKAYEELGDIGQARNLLIEIVEYDYAYSEAYIKLMDMFVATKEYEKIDEYLKKCTDSFVVESYVKYTANPPEFSEQSGNYDHVVTLKLLGNSYGEIYYTLDGTKPSVNSHLYISPIRLEVGEYDINAIFVNEYGIVSDMVSGHYEIMIDIPDEPEITVESGIYLSPIMIETELSYDFDVYYTTDGTVPTKSSNPYLGPIPMPLGDSVFKFVVFDDEGVSSNVATKEYSLRLDTNLLVDHAILIVKQGLINEGFLLDMAGHVAESGEIKEYECGSAFTEGEQVFYLITEYTKDEAENRSRTGNIFGVNIYTNELYRVSVNNSGYYQVIPFK